MSLYRRFGKRALDLSLAVPALVVLAPVGVVIGAVARAKLGSPVLFRQERPGRDAETFELIKLRTMSDARDADGALLPDDQRLTAFGALLQIPVEHGLPGQGVDSGGSGDHAVQVEYHAAQGGHTFSFGVRVSPSARPGGCRAPPGRRGRAG